jgi:hypothetical protein
MAAVLLFFASWLARSSFVGLTLFTFSFLTTGPADACFASRLSCLASTWRRFFVFWCCRLAFSIDAWLIVDPGCMKILFDCSLIRFLVFG